MRAAFTVVAFVAARVAFAQADTARPGGVATVSGVVRDSTAHANLADATVQLVSGAFIRTATTDSTGTFLLKDVPPGRYTLGFFHPVLDSIGIDAPLREIDVGKSHDVVADLAIPSPARIRRAICSRSPTADAGAVIIGTVRDGITVTPLKGVTVKGEWLEYLVNRTGVSPRIVHLEATTGENGWFALCNVPSSGSVTLRATRGSDSTGAIELQIPAEGYVRQEMYLAPFARESVVAAPQSSAGKVSPRSSPATPPIRVGDGSLTGKVVSNEGNRPIRNAQVMIVDGPGARTNDRGEFLLVKAPRGTQTLEVRAVGYYPDRRHINVITGAPPLNVSLATLKAVLDTVKIIAKRLPTGPDDGGFARRRRMGMGRYVTTADMARFPVINTADVFTRMPWMRADPKLLMRGAFERNQGALRGEYWCEASIFIDGRNMSFMTVEDINEWVHPDEVAGIEIYSEATVPPQFQVGLGGCGSVVIWTKLRESTTP